MFSGESVIDSLPHIIVTFMFRPVTKSNQSNQSSLIAFSFSQCGSSQFSILIKIFQFLSDQKPGRKKVRWKVKWKVRWKVRSKVRPKVKSKARSGFIAIDPLFYLPTKNKGDVFHHRWCHQMDHAKFFSYFRRSFPMKQLHFVREI